jgi:hypothetical protein
VKRLDRISRHRNNDLLAELGKELQFIAAFAVVEKLDNGDERQTNGVPVVIRPFSYAHGLPFPSIEHSTSTSAIQRLD